MHETALPCPNARPLRSGTGEDAGDCARQSQHTQKEYTLVQLAQAGAGVWGSALLLVEGSLQGQELECSQVK